MIAVLVIRWRWTARSERESQGTMSRAVLGLGQVEAGESVARYGYILQLCGP